MSQGCCPAPMQKGIFAREVSAHFVSLWDTKEHRSATNSGHPHTISSPLCYSCPSYLPQRNAKASLSPTQCFAGETLQNYDSCCPILKKRVWRFYFNCIYSSSFIQIITLTGDYLSGSSQCIFYFMLFLQENEQRSQHHWWVIHLTSKSELWQ